MCVKLFVFSLFYLVLPWCEKLFAFNDCVCIKNKNLEKPMHKNETKECLHWNQNRKRGKNIWKKNNGKWTERERERMRERELRTKCGIGNETRQ